MVGGYLQPHFFKMTKFTGRLNDALYGKLKEFADQNGFPSIIAAIRYILIQFLKEK